MPVKKNKIFVFIIIAFPIFFSIQAIDNSYGVAGVVFIANPSVEEVALSRSQIKDIFLGEKIVWENGESITIAILMEPSTHKLFTTQYLRRSSIQFIRYWRNRVFSGKGSMPYLFHTEKELVAFISKTEGAIGYISSGEVEEGTKILEIKE